MGYKKTFALLFLLCGGTSSILAQGSGWTSGFGKGYFKVEQRAIIADAIYTTSGDVKSIPNSAVHTTSFYAEFGILDRLDAITYVPIVNVAQEIQDEKNKYASKSALGDLQVGLKYGILREGPIVFSIGLVLGLPTGQVDFDDTPLPRLQTGDGEFNQSVHTDIGISFGSTYSAYVTAGVSYNNRTRGFFDEIGGYVHGGIHFFQHFLLEVSVDGLYPLQINKGHEPVYSNDSRYNTFLNDTQYLAYGANLDWNFFPKWSVSIGIDGASLSRNILAAHASFLGISFKI